MVDKNDQVVGTIDRSNVNGREDLPAGRYIRAASCFIINSRQQVWVPRRTLHKRIAPGGLDYSAGGHVSSGETYEEAILHEIAEEIGLALDSKDLAQFGRETPFDTPPYYYFSNLYIYRSDDEPNYNPDDFMSAEWLSVADLLSKLRAGTTAKTSLPSALEQLSRYLAEHKGDQ